MFSLYFTLKFIHVAAVIFWIGGIGALTILVLRAGKEKEKNPAGLAAAMGLSAYFGQRVIGPASGIALLAGFGLVIKGHMAFMTPWILWGFAGFVLHILLGVTLIRRNSIRLGQLASSPTPDANALAEALSRQRTYAAIYLLSMLSVVWAMVAKPT